MQVCDFDLGLHALVASGTRCGRGEIVRLKPDLLRGEIVRLKPDLLRGGNRQAKA